MRHPFLDTLFASQVKSASFFLIALGYLKR
nr:MAG TPA: hypothetical protein [Caudoviricetes sp.]